MRGLNKGIHGKCVEQGQAQSRHSAEAAVIIPSKLSVLFCRELAPIALLALGAVGRTRKWYMEGKR